METFHWDEHFVVGLDEVDHQHQRLVQLINMLGDSLIAGGDASPQALRSSFDQLADYARLHFAQEEALMVREGLAPAYRGLHGRRHAEFVGQLGSIWSTRDATPNPAELLHGFLRSWLAMHILDEDQSMARQIRAVQAGMSAEQAYEVESARTDNATAALLLAIESLYRLLTRQNADLVQANRQLEVRVLERTRELAEANQRLQALSNSDGLLGIANRRHFDARLKSEWARGARQHQPLSLLMIDVDHFKRYNDHYGHPAGDDCLKALARAVGAATTLKRPADLLARYGGEELAIVLPDTPAAGALAVADAVQRAIAALDLPHAASPVAPRVTVSMGAATMLPSPDTHPADLLAAADAALYAAKAGGRNRCVASGS